MTPLYRCTSCLGMGYKGRWESRNTGPRKWKPRTCPKCRGTGTQEKPPKNP